MRKDAEARRQWTPALTAQCASLQREIIADSGLAIRPGGYLIYSTCTFNRHENEENVEWIINTPAERPSCHSQSTLHGVSRPVSALMHGACVSCPIGSTAKDLFMAIIRKSLRSHRKTNAPDTRTDTPARPPPTTAAGSGDSLAQA